MLEGVLDIVERTVSREDDDSIAIDYAGTGWERHPAVTAIRLAITGVYTEKAGAEAEELRRLIEKVIENWEDDPREALTEGLDEIDARDSLQYLKDKKGIE
jgi:hypothetical protein